MIRNISIELKVVISIVLFTILIVGLERYQLSENIIEQFIESKKSKQNLLKETISPILALNISLGLDEANEEYLDYIVKQNSDLKAVELVSSEKKKLYSYLKNSNEVFKRDITDMNFCTKQIVDPITQETLGSVYLYFSDNQYQKVLEENAAMTLKIFLITIVLLGIFVTFIKREFRDLKELSNNVMLYDPKLNNLTLAASDRKDEVGIIHNAIISMAQKINLHAKLLDELNASLERKVKERTQELEVANIRLRELSVTDSLTELANRREFERKLKEIWETAKRTKVKISLIMSDIDHFKKVNDTYGHHVGDVVLKKIANILKNSPQRSTDFVARYGGEEFVIILFDTNGDRAQKVCVNIQDKLKKMDYTIDGDTVIEAVQMSFGVNTLIPTDTNSSDNLFRLADLALYEAKGRGRNCIVHNVDGNMVLGSDLAKD